MTGTSFKWFQIITDSRIVLFFIYNKKSRLVDKITSFFIKYLIVALVAQEVYLKFTFK